MEKECNQIIDNVCEYICYEWSTDKINTCDDFKRIAVYVNRKFGQPLIEN